MLEISAYFCQLPHLDVASIREAFPTLPWKFPTPHHILEYADTFQTQAGCASTLPIIQFSGADQDSLSHDLRKSSAEFIGVTGIML